jgi:gluconokinase
MRARAGHFMPLALLDNQLATFEPPGDDELAIAVDGYLPVAEQVALILPRLPV